MSEEDEKSGSVTRDRPEDEAFHLKTLAEENYNSGNLNSALEYANRAHKLCSSINGLSEMLIAFKILAAAPISESSSTTEKSTLDYYSILQVERFSHINLIKKQYKKLALTLHPDKNPLLASEDAFKLVGEAARVLSDKIRRKEYDMKLRIAMQSKAAEEVQLGAEGAGETFWTACSSCGLLHQFERKYLGHDLMCPRCKNTFKAMEVEENRNDGDEGIAEKNEWFGGGQTRVSARIRERVAKGGPMGVVEKFGLGVKRKASSVGEVSEGRAKRVEKVRKSGEGDGGGSSKNVRDGVERLSKGGGGELVESERIKRAEDSEEETMTLSQIQMLMKNKKRKTRKETEVNAEELQEKENVREEEREQGIEEENRVSLREKRNRRRVSMDRKLEAVNHLPSETVKGGSSKKGNLGVLVMEEEDGKEKEKEIENKREKRERRTRYSKNHMGSEVEMLIASEKGSLEIMPVEDSDFHDFDKDRRERSFKKGQVWALYDEDDGMPRHYGLIDRVVSRNPFKVIFIWLRFQSNGDKELLSWPNTGSHVSCGIFQLSRKVTIKYLNVFSHLVDCERAARELYRIYPKKGSVWAMCSNSAPQAEERNQRDKGTRCYDIVVSLSSYSDIHGLSVAYLEKVPGFRTVFKRKEVGASAVICLGLKDVKLLSHQIPAKKLSGEESSNLPKDCWELDPASLTPPLIIAS